MLITVIILIIVYEYDIYEPRFFDDLGCSSLCA